MNPGSGLSYLFVAPSPGQGQPAGAREWVGLGKGGATYLLLAGLEKPSPLLALESVLADKLRASGYLLGRSWWDRPDGVQVVPPHDTVLTILRMLSHGAVSSSVDTPRERMYPTVDDHDIVCLRELDLDEEDEG